MKNIMFLLFTIFIFACSNDNQNKNGVKKQFANHSSKEFEITYDKSKISKYSIEKEDVSSMKAMDRRLSEYSNKELDKLPTKIKNTYSMVVPTNVSRENLENTLKYFVIEKTSKDLDIDEIVVFVYDNKNDVGKQYTFGKLVWAPNGEIGNVTSEIASKNDRSNYKIKIDIRGKVGNINEIIVPTEKELAIYDMVMDTKYSSLSDEALDKKVMKKFGIKSKKELNEIFYKVMNYKSL